MPNLKAALLLSLAWPLAACAQPEEQPVDPRSLGAGTGGDGVWAGSGAAHSPTTIKVDETAGPEGTPAAVLEFTFSPGKYNYNWAEVACGSANAAGCVAVRVTYKTEMPDGFPALNLMVRESTGAGYWVPGFLPPSPTRFRTETVALDRFAVPSWSKDENGELDTEQINRIALGLETGRSGKGRVLIADVELVPPGW